MLKLKKEPNMLDLEIRRVMTDMSIIEHDSEEYKLLLTHLERLMALKTESRRKPLSADSILGAATQILGIVLIVTHEQQHVITSKAMSLFKKPT